MKTIEAEERKTAIWKILVNNPMTIKKLSELMSISESKLTNTLRALKVNGNLTMEYVYDIVACRTVCEYKSIESKPYHANIVKPKSEREYEKRIIKAMNKKMDEDMIKLHPSARVIRLLDEPLEQPVKKKRSSAYKGIGSSFAIFDNY